MARPTEQRYKNTKGINTRTCWNKERQQTGKNKGTTKTYIQEGRQASKTQMILMRVIEKGGKRKKDRKCGTAKYDTRQRLQNKEDRTDTFKRTDATERHELVVVNS